MHKLMVAAGAAALLAASSFAALAAEVTGTISSIDATSATVTLDNGQVYKLPQAFDAASLQVGESVKIMFETGTDGSNAATAVEKAM